MSRPTLYLIRTTILIIAVVLLIAISVVYLFHTPKVPQNSKTANKWPLYWSIMERSLSYERQGRYAEAIAGYRSAMPYAKNLSPDLARRAKIAIYNRIGACYMKMSELEQALEAFQESLKIGDTKYAPQKISEIAPKLQDR